ncbi:MAG: M48 family metalloprotease [Coriobacteriia bacterium]|nr:M48 family metalloprotease [Coriobacteriia bacterium]
MATTTYTEISSNKWRTVVVMTVFVAAIIALGYVFGVALDLPWLLPLAIVIAVAQSFSSYWWSDKVALAISSAHEVDKAQAPELYRLVENLSIASGLPMPRVYIVDDPSPNAFATGRDPQHAAIAVTTGLLGKLTKPELEGVLAHELSHIGNYDILLSSVVVVLVGFVVLLSDFFLRYTFWFGGGRRRSSSSGDAGQLGAIMMIVGIVLALLSPLFAMLIQLAISRRRELLADASGALLTRNPDELADALEKITADPLSMHHVNKATAHLWIASPLHDTEGKTKGWMAGLFDTHPDPAVRIARLREMAR